MARTKGALGKKTLAKLAAGDTVPAKAEKSVIRTYNKKAAPVYIPYEKSKEDKNGQVITYQTYHLGSQWLIDVFTDGDLTLKGVENNIVSLLDAIRFIDADISLL